MESSQISIVYDYSEQSHVLLGDFKNTHAKFREEVLHPAEYAHFNSRLYTGPGWLVEKVRVDDLINSLKNYNLNFAESKFDKEIRTLKRKENWRKASKRRSGRKTARQPVVTHTQPQPTIVDTPPQRPLPPPEEVDKPSQPMAVDTPSQPVVDYAEWFHTTIYQEYLSLNHNDTFIHRSVVKKILNYVERHGAPRKPLGINIFFTVEERVLVNRSMARLRQLGFTVLNKGIGNYCVTRP